MSNPASVLRLCCVVVGVVSISSITFFGTPGMKVKLYQDYENQSGLNGDLFGSNYCHIKLGKVMLLLQVMMMMIIVQTRSFYRC